MAVAAAVAAARGGTHPGGGGGGWRRVDQYESAGAYSHGRWRNARASANGCRQHADGTRASRLRQCTQRGEGAAKGGEPIRQEEELVRVDGEQVGEPVTPGRAHRVAHVHRLALGYARPVADRAHVEAGRHAVAPRRAAQQWLERRGTSVPVAFAVPFVLERLSNTPARVPEALSRTLDLSRARPMGAHSDCSRGSGMARSWAPSG